MGSIETALRLARDGSLGRVLGRRFMLLIGIDIPVGNRYFGGMAACYDDNRISSEAWKWEDRVIASHLSRCAPGKRVLDVPFGTGRFVPHYLQAGCIVFGVDASEDMLEGARRTHGASLDAMQLLVSDASDLPFPDNDFDLAVCFRFLPGIVTARQAADILRELARVTRGEALILLKHRADDAPRRWHDRWSRLGARSPRQLREFLSTNGWEVMQVTEMAGTNRAVYRCQPS